MSRTYIVASHAHFAQGLVEGASFLAGERNDVRVLNAFVDGTPQWMIDEWVRFARESGL